MARLLIPFVLAAWMGQAQSAMPVPAGQLVNLELAMGVKDGCGESQLEFFPAGAGGGGGARGPYRVPPGRSLVVTDVDWHYWGGAPHLSLVLTLLAENLPEPGKGRRIFESLVRLGPDGVGGAGARLTSGAVVPAGARLCVELRNGLIGTPPRLSKVLVRGYLSEAVASQFSGAEQAKGLPAPDR